MERQMPEQNIPRPKLKKKQGVGVDSISDDQKLRAMNPHINTKSSSSSQLPRYLPPNDQRVNSAYNRVAPIISTRNPTPQKKDRSFRIVKNRISANNRSNEDRADKGGSGGDFSILSSKKTLAQKNREEVNMLREQLDELQKKLLEKEDSFKSSQFLVDELKHQTCEKDAQLKSFHSELTATKIKLADKQATVETLDWKIRVANNKVENLQAEADSKDFEISAFMKFFEELMENTSTAQLDTFDHLPNIDVDEDVIKETVMEYEATLATAKENPCDETLNAASLARTKLQYLVQ
ncbi:hypothetical protein ZOSMA_2G00610 [Zostera marina]|uniref:Uncharacterized protein n=1 Tax=Zostera marina TaxID=29655 RepID=A0A0K9PAQ2_ZOSMR|nr:hypothetical protein ZOSMA_2G00610 [Zostera marina]